MLKKKKTSIPGILTKDVWSFNVSLPLQISFKMSTESETKGDVMEVPSKYNGLKINVIYMKCSPNE